MRGVYSSKAKGRHDVFRAVAKLAFDGADLKRIDEIPYELVRGEESQSYDNIFLERAVIGERLRVALGLPIRDASEYKLISDGVENAATEESYYTPPLINIIKFACHACPDHVTVVTNLCQNCIEHPCREVCPKHAITLGNRQSVIDRDKCVNCGRCIAACPYNAIIRMDRPCMKACGMGAIREDENGRAEIDYSKCVACGMCLVSCPFSAIVDKSQIYQTIMALKDTDTPVYAVVAPSFVGQFGPKSDQQHLRAALKALGFADMVEVAVGADLCTIQEARDFLREVPDKIPFMGTSCCPAWSVMAKTMFPKYANCISMTFTPMVFAARMTKKQHPGCKTVFIGPCAAKKLEARRRTVRSEVDYVLTFEEMSGIFDAAGISFDNLSMEPEREDSTADGKGFATGGGVAKAVIDRIHTISPGREVPTARAEGLADCRKMMQLAVAGKYNGYLLEGMGCPGGCIGGSGVLQDVKKSAASLQKQMTASQKKKSGESGYQDYMDLIE